MAGPKPQGYSALQIGLHWAVALLVVLQFLDHDGIEEAWRAMRGGEAAPLLAPSTNVHVVVGIAIFVLALWRVWLRITRGAPAAPPNQPKIFHWIATATHVLIYALIIGLPISGSAAWFAGIQPAAGVHVIGKSILLALVILHVAGALFEQFVLRSGILTRMAVPKS